MRVLHGPVNVGNQPWTLSRAERRQGVESDLVVDFDNWLKYPADRFLGTYPGRSPADLARRIGFGLGAPFRYDVLHYYFGRSYLFFRDIGGRLSLLAPLIGIDLKLARRRGCKVFMTMQGCDARIAGNSERRNAWTMCNEGRCGFYASCIKSYDRQRRRDMDKLLPHCDRVFYLNPELGHELPADAVFLPYASMPIGGVVQAPPRASGRPRIVHAPSNGSIKGTAMILAALERLKSRFDFELVLVEGKPHAEAMEIYRTADLAIDQILAGWYGGFAVEIMAMGKPVACAIRAADLGFVPDAMRRDLPMFDLDPAHLDDTLAAMLARRAEWPAVGARSRAFVERWHDPDRIAAAMIACYRDPQSRFRLFEEAA